MLTSRFAQGIETAIFRRQRITRDREAWAAKSMWTFVLACGLSKLRNSITLFGGTYYFDDLTVAGYDRDLMQGLWPDLEKNV